MSKYYELTEVQKSIWYVEQLYPDTPVNTIGGYVRIRGDICFSKLQKALWTFIEMHKGVRIQIKKQAECPLQYISKQKLIEFPFFNFTLYRDPWLLFSQWLVEEFSKPFKLHDSPLFHFAFFRLGKNDCGYLIKLHHLIADMYSISLLTEQVKQLYEMEGRDNCTMIQGSNYFDYVIRERKYLQSKRFMLDQAYWLKSFSFLKSSSLKGSFNPTNSKRLCFTIEETDRVRQFLSQHQFSLNELFNALIGCYFYLKKKKVQQIIGIPIFNRATASEKQIIGMFASTLPFSFEVDPEFSGLNFCQYIKKKLRESYFHHYYPFNTLLNELSRNGIDLKSAIEVSINFYHKGHPLCFDGFEVSNEECAKQHQIYPLHLIIHEWQTNQIRFYIEYQIAAYNEEEVELMAVDLKQILAAIISCPNQKIGTILLQSQRPEKFDCLPYKHPQPSIPIKHKTIIDLFEEKASQYPQKVAIQDKDQTLTFSQLRNKVDQFALFLEKNVGGEGIAIWGEPSIECVIAILAIHKVGRFYLPIDPQESLERINHMMQEASIRTLLTWTKAESLKDLDSQIINIQFILKSYALVGTEASNASKATPNSLAYIIYTSGSTGRPKGVKVTHANLFAYLQWAQMYANHDCCVFAFYSSIAFDLTVTSIFLPLIGGNKIKVFQSNGQYILLPILADPEVTLLKATPSHLYLIKDNVLTSSSLRSLIVGGEDFKTDLAHKLQKLIGEQLSIYNEYGPTEATVGCMIHRFNPSTDQAESVPIGCAAGNTQLLVLNEENMPINIGEKGELYIGGDQVAQGYLNQAESTEERFLILSYASTPFYKTGDIVRLDKNKSLVFCGRRDEQIKLNGYRIELGEIQEILLAHPKIKNGCIAIVEYGPNRVIGAFFLSDKQLDIREIRGFLSLRLPPHKIPSLFFQIGNIPLTSNGKVNKSALQQIVDVKIKEEGNKKTLQSLKEVVLNTIQEVLQQDIALTANYFQTGGDSILAIQISSKLALQGIELKVKDILSAKTVEDILICAEEKEKKPLSSTPSSGKQPLTSVLKWFFLQNFSQLHYYHQSLLLRLTSSFRLDQIERCLNALIDNHDVFFLNYEESQKTLFYNHKAKKNKKIIIYCVDCSDIGEENLQEHMERIAISLKNQTNIKNGPLLSAAVIFTQNKEQYLLLSAHHICVDGISWQILLEDLDQIMQSCKNHQHVLSPKMVTSSFQQWVNEITPTSQPNKKLDEYFSAIPTSLISPTISIRNEKIHCFRFTLPKEKTEQISQFSQGFLKIHINEILATAFLLTLCHLQDKNCLLVTFEHHGRFIPNDKIDLRKSIGWFTVMCPLYLKVFPDMEETIKEVRQALELFHEHIPILSLNNTYLEKYPSPYRFNYLGVLATNYLEFSLEQISIGPDSHPLNTSPLIDLNAYIMQNEISHLLFMPTSLPFSPDIFIHVYRNKIDEIVIHLQSKMVSRYLLNLDTVRLDQDEIEELIKL